MTSVFDISAEVLVLNVLEEISSRSLKTFLLDKKFFKHIHNVYPWIIKDCFTPVKPLFGKDYNNVHDMKQYLGSKDMNLTDKIITILNYEWCFVNPLRTIIRIIKERDQKVCNQFVDDIITKHYSCSPRSPKTLTPLIKFFIDEMKYDPSNNNNYAIRNSSKFGHNSVVKMLLKEPLVDPSDLLNDAIALASLYGHQRVVKLLLSDPRVDPSDDDNYAINLASTYGYPRVVKLLLSDSRVDPNRAIFLASERKHTSVVELLINDPRIDPTALENEDNSVLTFLLKNIS